MAIFDRYGNDDVGFVYKYYCTNCEQFIELSPIAPSVCPHCWADQRYIIGPFPVRDVDLDKALSEYRRSKKYKSTRK